MTQSERINAALDIAFRYGQTDGAHHRLWVIDQMVRALTGVSYDEWVAGYEVGGPYDGERYAWETGIAP